MAIERLLDLSGNPPEPQDLYMHLHLPDGGPERPYVVMNMVATMDGKTLLGPRGGSAHGLGGPTDQLLMRRIQANVEGALIGAGTVRAGNIVYEPRLLRATVTRTGNLPLENRFFTDAPEKCIVFAPSALPAEQRTRLERAARVEILPEDGAAPAEILGILRRTYGVKRCVLEGGADLNWMFVEAGLVDEYFLTLAPKVKGGAHLPTVVDGPGFPGSEHAALALVSIYRDGDEIYLRYRTRR